MNPSLLIVLLSLLFSAFFSGMEIALLSANKLRIELDRKQNKLYTKVVGFFLRRPSEYISTMLMGNNITLVVYGIAMAQLCDPVIREYTTSSGWILAIETVFSTFVVLITAELLPKIIGRLNPKGLLKTLCWAAFLFYILLYPLTKFVSLLSIGALRLFGIKMTAKRDKMLFNKADLMNLSNEVNSSQAEENEYEHDIEIFQNALDFSEVRIRECMVPRTDLVAIEEKDSFETLHQEFIRSGYSRVLVYRETIDNIIGYVHAKGLFSTAPKTVAELLRPIDFIPETMSAQKLLASLIKQKKALAVVVDEYGGTAGIVTIEDMIEEIFGEINDEHDSDNIVDIQLSEEEFEFSGRVEVKYINKEYELNIPESDDYETLAGYITYHNENIPQQGDVLQFGRFRFRILKTTATKIDLVHLTLVKSY
jgi:CBS domain containing-hemolysin-like protein